MLHQRSERFGHGGYIVKDQQIRHEMVVFDDFSLLVPKVFGDHPIPSEQDPLNEAVELLALASCRLDHLTQLGFTDISQQEDRPNNPAELPERQIQLVLSGVGAQSAQNRRRGDLTSFDGDGDPQEVRQVSFDEVPTNAVGEQGIDVLVRNTLV